MEIKRLKIQAHVLLEARRASRHEVVEPIAINAVHAGYAFTSGNVDRS